MRFLTVASLLLGVVFVQAYKTSGRTVKGKMVVITGGAGDICSAIADKCLEKGASSVILVDINQKKGEVVAANLNNKYGEGKAMFFHRDVTTDLPYVLANDVPAVGIADVMFNCAGKINENDVRETVAVNLIAPIEWTEAMYELTRADKGGKGSTVVNVGDLYAYYLDSFLPKFSGSSAGVKMYTGKMGHEARNRHTSVDIIAALLGFVNTTMTAGQMEVDELHEDFSNYMTKWPWMQADEAASLVMDVFEVAKSGESYTVDGGKYFKSPAIEYASAEEIDRMVESA